MKPTYEELEAQVKQLAAYAGYLRGEIVQHSNSTHFCEKCGEADPRATDDVCLALKAEMSWEKTMMQACGEDGPASVAEKFAQLEAQVKQLGAESAQMKSMNDDRRMFIMNGVQLGYIKVPTVETDPALETIRIAVSPQEPTPATDAFLSRMRNEARAEGVEMFAKENQIWARHYEKHGVRDGSVERRRLAAYSALDFARQLREGKAGEVCSE